MFVIIAFLVWAYLSGIILLFGAFLSVAYYQLKQLQFRRGVLDANYTYAGLYFKNFLRTHKSHQFAVPPYSIIQTEVFAQGFETADYNGPRLKEQVCKGEYATVLDAQNEFTREFGGDLPAFFFDPGLAKIRFSVWCFPEQDISEFQVYMNFYSKSGQQTLSIPFYVKEDALRRNKWTDMQFGHEFSAGELVLLKDCRVALFVWNSARKNRLFVDEASVEIYLCDRSAEIVP